MSLLNKTILGTIWVPKMVFYLQSIFYSFSILPWIQIQNLVGVFNILKKNQNEDEIWGQYNYHSLHYSCNHHNLKVIKLAPNASPPSSLKALSLRGDNPLSLQKISCQKNKNSLSSVEFYLYSVQLNYYTFSNTVAWDYLRTLFCANFIYGWGYWLFVFYARCLLFGFPCKSTDSSCREGKFSCGSSLPPSATALAIYWPN